MPWDESVVMSANGVLAQHPNRQHQQPQTDTTGQHLAWLDDSSGWLNVATQSGTRANEPFEHGSPTWGDGQRSWCFNSDGSHIAFVRNEDGFVSHRLTFMAALRAPTQNSASQVVIDFDHFDEAITVAMIINIRQINA
jgi:hypothetical protein